MKTSRIAVAVMAIVAGIGFYQWYVGPKVHVVCIGQMIEGECTKTATVKD